MRLRSLLLLTIVAAIVGAAGLAHRFSARARQTSTQNVSLGGATFIPSTLTRTGTSKLVVAVSTGAGVPAQGPDGTPIRAVVQVQESSNFAGISYSVSDRNGAPTQIQTIGLSGGGRASNAEFNFTIDSQNTKAGTIAYRATLVRLENNTGLAQTAAPLTADASLSITAATPTPTPTPVAGGGGGGCTVNWTLAAWCPSYDFDSCYCPDGVEKSPVLVDVGGDGFSLTDVEHGVNFDLDGDGLSAERVAWTAADSDDAFLFLDRNEDGAVNNGTELFGNFTPQPFSTTPNGFVALGVYDTGVHGGNGDGVIDAADAAYPQLRLWRDANHNGVSEPGELHALPDMGVASISLDFKESKRTDQFGNQFRYRSRVGPVRGAGVAKWAWDVFLLSQ